jgi:hypothetical protein
MTAADNQAIRLLGEALDRIHDDLKADIAGTEQRLLAKITELCGKVNKIQVECDSRKLHCAEELAKMQLATEAEIAAEGLKAVAVATAPSVYKQATRGAFNGLMKFALKAAVIAGLLSSVIVLLDKLGLL